MGKLSDFATANSRAKLQAQPRGEPHWRFLGKGRALGYRPHGSRESAGSWVVRCLVPGEKKYRKATLGVADDGRRTPDGETVLAFDEASRKALEWCDDQERAFQGLEPRQRGPYTVARAMDEYIEWMRAHRKAPQQAEQVNRAHVLPELGDLEVAKLTPSRIRKWHQKIADSPPLRRTAKGKKRNVGSLEDPEARRKRRSTANRALAVLKAALNMAYREGWVPSDDAWRRVKAFKGVDRPKVRYLELDEVTRLLNACEPDFRRLVRGALFTGCRYGELRRLRVGDFQATPMPLIRLDDTKGGRGRHVYLNDEGTAFFQELTAGRPPGDPMFVRASGEPWGRSHQTRRMEKASKVAAIEPLATFHDLRHTYASHYLMNGGDLYGLSQQLGHADTRMTTHHYAHLADRWRAEQARRHVPSFGGSPGEPATGKVVRFGRDSVDTEPRVPRSGTGS